MIRATIEAWLKNIQKERYQKESHYDVTKQIDDNTRNAYARIIEQELMNESLTHSAPIDEKWIKELEQLLLVDEITGSMMNVKESAGTNSMLAASRCLVKYTRQNRFAYRNLRRIEKKVHRRKKRNLDELGNAEIEQLYQNRDIRALYKK